MNRGSACLEGRKMLLHKIVWLQFIFLQLSNVITSSFYPVGHFKTTFSQNQESRHFPVSPGVHRPPCRQRCKRSRDDTRASCSRHLFSVEQKKDTQGLRLRLSEDGGRYMASDRQVSSNFSSSALKEEEHRTELLHITER